jgi:hypothetical protein
MALASTQPITEMGTRNFPGVKGRPALSIDNSAICEMIITKYGSLDVLQPCGLPLPGTGIYLLSV